MDRIPIDDRDQRSTARTDSFDSRNRFNVVSVQVAKTKRTRQRSLREFTTNVERTNLALLDLSQILIQKKRQEQSGVCLLISYDTQLLQEICFQSSVAIRFLGEEAAMSLQARHADLQAADNVFDLLVGQVSVAGNLCTLTVRDVLSIVMSPNYVTAASGSTYDWSTVGRIKVMGINDVK